MSLIETRILNIQAKSPIDKWETRASKYGVWDLFNRDTKHPFSVTSPELIKKAFSSIGSTIDIPVIDFDGGVTIGNTRNVIITDSENTSKRYNVAFKTYAWGYTQVPSLFLNNEIGQERDWAAKFLKYLYAFMKELDADCATALTTKKSQVYGDLLEFANVGNVITATSAQEQKILGALNSIMESNDYDGDGLNIVGNQALRYLVSQMDEKATYNSENKTIQYADKNLGYSNRVTNATDDKLTGFAVVPGSLGVLTRVEREALMKAESGTSHKWDVIDLPLFGHQVGYYTYDSVGDYSGIAGAASADQTRALKKHHGFAVDVALVTPYIGDLTNNATPINKFAVTIN